MPNKDQICPVFKSKCLKKECALYPWIEEKGYVCWFLYIGDVIKNMEPLMMKVTEMIELFKRKI